MRNKSEELKYYELLKSRRSLEKEEQSRYLSLLRGYQGECQLDNYIETIIGDTTYYIKDLTLHHSRTTQIDSLLMTNDTMYQFEVKNYSSNLVWDGYDWKFDSGFCLSDDPSVQLMRSCNILKALLQELGYKKKLIPILVFINPDTFVDLRSETSVKTLRSYEIRNFLEEIKSSYFAGTSTDRKWKNQICQSLLKCKSEWRFETPKDIDVPKGVICSECGNTNLVFTNQLVKCSCGKIERKGDALIRTIKEAQQLLPDFKLKRKNVRDFTEDAFSVSSITRALRKLRN